MQPVKHADLYKILTNQRLTPYKTALADTPEMVFTRYSWNIRLCESLYPSLHGLELAIRNSISNAASLMNGTNWLQNNSVLAPTEQAKVREAEAKLTKANKPISNGALVAELSFGFWNSLFDRRYDQVLWPKLLSTCFPYIPKVSRTRTVISGRLSTIRSLRNRVFHHEPIWRRTNLDQNHTEILELLGWISPELAKLIDEVDTFKVVLAGGPAPQITCI